MPSRFTIAIILIFFVGMAGWQWFRNFGSQVGEGPQLKPSLDLAAQDGTTEWKMWFNKQRLGEARTVVSKTPMGVFVLKQLVMLDGDLELFMGPMGAVAKLWGIKLNDYRAFLNSEMELTYLGTIRKINMSFSIRRRPVLTPADLEREKAGKKPMNEQNDKDDATPIIQMLINGDTRVVDYLSFHGNISIAGIRIPIDDVKIKHRSKDTFLSNMAPTDCLAGIRLGQRWQTPVIDPTQLLTGAVYHSKAKEISSGTFSAEDLVKTKVAEVRVLDELRELEWNGQRIPCFVAQSSEKGSKMQIWINASNNRVIKQVYESDRHLVELIRDPPKKEE